MGSTGAEINNRDGAILTGTFFNPAVYIGSYTSDAYVGITTVNTPVNGTEICYSGSFSGTTCGNIVSQPIYNYSLTGVGNITGLMTANPQGLPAFGNGDSGGPGIAVFQHTCQRRPNIDPLSSLNFDPLPLCQAGCESFMISRESG